MKKLLLFILPFIFVSCDMGTPAPSNNYPKNNQKILELSQKGQYFKVLTVIFKDGNFVFVPLKRENLKHWTATLDNNKKVKVKSETPKEIATELFGAKVKEARWASGN
jgi:hypothetical protein